MSSPATPDFGRLAEAYDRVRPTDANWWEVYSRVSERATLRGRRVLDVGCGTGRLSAALVEDGARVWGVDASAEMLAVAKTKVPNGGFKRAAAERLPFTDAWFERVVFWLVVHLVDRGRAFAEARRVLAPGGQVAVVTFDHAHFTDFWLNDFFPSIEEIDRARFPTREALHAELEEAGFAEIELERVSQRTALSRAQALERIEERHISTFDLLPPGEVADGTERARRELPERVDYGVEWLLAFGRA